ncbi:MAG: CotH kinase family protein [Actinomycetota bacterium]|nr:CotH kinase family protein [Actinomycetota bacterium]
MKIRIGLTALALAASTLAFSSGTSAAPLPLEIHASDAAPIAGETITVTGSLPDEVARPINLQRLNADGVTWDEVPVTPAVTTASTGAFSFPYKVDAVQKIRAHAPATTIGTTDYVDRETDALDLTITPNKGVLDPMTDTGAGTSAKATVTFEPVRAGQATELQKFVRRTVETDEENSEVDKVKIGVDKKGKDVFIFGKWVKVASGKQDAEGKTTFSVSNPREANHFYRAVTNTTDGPKTTSNNVEFAASVGTKNTGLSTVYFNSNEADPVDTRTHYFEGEFSMTTGAGCTAVAKMPESVMKGRGNYSWSFAKKSFTLKLAKKTDLCGMGNSKKWALIANHYDKSLLRTAVAFNIGQALDNMAWTPKGHPVDLYMNGSYRGSYQLVERIAIDPNRVNVPELKELKYDHDNNPTTPAVDTGQAVDPNHPNNQEPNKTGGYILEWDFRKGADYNAKAGSRGYVGVKDPENDLNREGNKTDFSISSQQKSYINGYLDAADKALFGSNFKDPANGWRKYIDEASAVDYYIGMEMMKPVDGNMWASVYMYKQRDSAAGAGDGKLFMGPMWDFDLAAGSANREGNTVGKTGWYLRNQISTTAKQSSKTWFNRLNEDSTFRTAVKNRWKVVYADLNQDAFIAAQKTLIQASATENFKKWNVKERDSTVQVLKGSWSSEVSYVKGWISGRRNWMNGQLK